MSTLKRWRGLKDLVKDAVGNGSTAIKRVQLDSARGPFEMLKRVSPLTEPVTGIEAIHRAAVSTVHGSIQIVNLVVAAGLDVVLNTVEATQKPTAPAPEEPPPAAPPGTDDPSTPR